MILIDKHMYILLFLFMFVLINKKLINSITSTTYLLAKINKLDKRYPLLHTILFKSNKTYIWSLSKLLTKQVLNKAFKS